jgi:hypothetical protein
MNYFDQLRQGGSGYEVRDNSAASFSIYCDQTDDEAIRAFQRVARAAKAHEDGDWEVKLAPPRGFKIRSIRGLQDPVYLMAAISKLTP